MKRLVTIFGVFLLTTVIQLNYNFADAKCAYPYETCTYPQPIFEQSSTEYTVGQINWNQAGYPVNKTATIQVIDPDMNKIKISKDMIKVHVYSDSNKEGIVLEVFETAINSGVFEKTIVLHNKRSAPNILYTLDGDTITARYIDYTLPAPYKQSENLEKIATAIVGARGPPLERVPASFLRATDSDGNTMKNPTIQVDQQIKISADIANNYPIEQNFTYLVMVQDEKGKADSLSWIEGTLTAGQSFSPSQSWTPSQPGKYMVTIFVWESIDNPTALSPPLDMEVNVINEFFVRD
ncbi:hypothetical protein C6988_08575 [Nitrosopumilus sp. b1]|uniref:hypothetical protein n=1 Tax=Nitrosopumilus sp. b1 TaxID=2109907 RepID=UPI0015F4EB01|nr:hypothetical protein [Nitrosopumilus sp. b1]KAF6242440.1 hypothetical protein C6988_08575 [Nitrosopumilus sp. b1]